MTVRSQVGPVEPARLPAGIVVVLVADAGQPVRRRALVDHGHAVERLGRLLVRREDRDARDLECRTGRRRRRARRPRPSLPGPAGSTGALRRSPNDERLVLLEDAQPDLLDLVAEGGRPLELELLGRGLHLRFHPGDELLDPAVFSRSAPGRSARRAPRCRPRFCSATARRRSLMSWMPLTIVVGSIPRSRL